MTTKVTDVTIAIMKAILAISVITIIMTAVAIALLLLFWSIF